jgi:hypothetical protein|tara:strand:- start:154 stop:387 length:234 start_codon:yes stop_codon:yes gene_type:complete
LEINKLRHQAEDVTGHGEAQEKFRKPFLPPAADAYIPQDRVEPSFPREKAEKRKIGRLRPIDLIRLQNGPLKPAGGH